MHRFYAPPESFSERAVVFDRDETRHLRDVIRLKTGDTVNVFDGAGREFKCRILEIKKSETTLSIVEEVSPTSPESPLDLTLAAAMLKGEKFDLIVQKAVELGVKALVPLRTIRCDIKSKDSMKRHDRWRKITLEASKQTGRATLMRVGEPVTFEELLSGVQDGDVILFSERGGQPLRLEPDHKKLTAIVGPEGGWDDSEIESAKNTGVTIVTLGGRILRAETAAIAIAAVLQHRLGDLN
jgi:16S rRNA (uracil1498-N3)-methyltransferase